MSPCALEIAGIKTLKGRIPIYDEDLSWGKFAELAVQHDKLTMQHGHWSGIEYGELDAQIFPAISTKTALYDGEEMIGIFCSATLILSQSHLEIFRHPLIVDCLIKKEEININLENNAISLLTTRQKQILLKYVFHKSAKEIANELLITPKTVYAHIEQIKEKLNCSDNTELLKKVIRNIMLWQ